MVEAYNIMCFQLKLKVQVFRVASKANPADLPSRGKNPPCITNRMKINSTPIRWRSSEKSESK